MIMPTRQEMFDRAVRGLASQNWERCVDAGGGCVYSDGAGRHCAWGWVDPEGTASHWGDVCALRDKHIGIAAKLGAGDLGWATELQHHHDGSVTRTEMRERLAAFGKKSGLTWPADVPLDSDLSRP